MEHFAPLIETALWVGLIGGIVWRYHKPFDAILQSLQKHIESGGGVKAGPIELRAALKPQDSVEQKQNVVLEVSQVTQDLSTGEHQEPKTITDEDKQLLFSRAFQAEDLALRAIQIEYGEPIMRQQQIGPDLKFDGFFVQHGKAHIVQVIYTPGELKKKFVERNVESVFTQIGRYGWTNVCLILALVYDSDAVDLPAEKKRLNRILVSYKNQVTINCYTFADLRTLFGIE